MEITCKGRRHDDEQYNSILPKSQTAIIPDMMPLQLSTVCWNKKLQKQENNGSKASRHPPVSIGAIDIQSAKLTSPDTALYNCTECFASFLNSYALEQHAKCAGHKPYVCQERDCGKRYSRRDTYIRHVSAHKRLPTHVCPECSSVGQAKAFNRKDHLLQHLRACHPHSSRASSVAHTKWSDNRARHDNYLDLDIATNDGINLVNICSSGLAVSGDATYESLDAFSLFPHPVAVTALTGNDHPEKQRRSMKNIIHELKSILGDGHCDLLHKLEQRVEMLNPGYTTEDVALGIAELALDRTNESAESPASCLYPSDGSRKRSR